MSGKRWGTGVGVAIVWCDSEDCSWGCALILGGFWMAHYGCTYKLTHLLTRATANKVFLEI